ncbi:uncharacterized protein [Miscanthus floridulus]|uniref:uncharacterized protein n=1 Tax=Miscanthus floridulus TaxID=154761 RepID=UPI0034583A6F
MTRCHRAAGWRRPRSARCVDQPVVLDAYNNCFVGPLSRSLDELRRLQRLNLGDNFFNGSVPTKIGQLRSLRFLHLAENVLTRRLPSELDALASLEQLEIRYNVYDGGVPTEQWREDGTSAPGGARACPNIVVGPWRMTMFQREATLLHYEYMPNGSLDDLLHDAAGAGAMGKVGLDWDARHQIAVGMAQGMSYLHHDCVPAVAHRDLKPSNILLDADIEARVANFGIAKALHDAVPMSVVVVVLPW